MNQYQNGGTCRGQTADRQSGWLSLNGFECLSTLVSLGTDSGTTTGRPTVDEWRVQRGQGLPPACRRTRRVGRRPTRARRVERNRPERVRRAQHPENLERSKCGQFQQHRWTSKVIAALSPDMHERFLQMCSRCSFDTYPFVDCGRDARIARPKAQEFLWGFDKKSRCLQVQQLQPRARRHNPCRPIRW